MEFQYKQLSIFFFVVFLLFLGKIFAQSNNLRRGKKFRKEIAAGEDGKLFKALQVLYPLRLFDPSLLENDRNWRSPGIFNKDLATDSAQQKGYLNLARAQDQEDVWLYENWFYGIKHGIILESGALDGLTFSTSWMFENFANWTAIHVGKFLRTNYIFLSLIAFEEADPSNFYKLKNQREHAVNVNGALCSESKLLHYSSHAVIPARGFIEFMSPSFIKKWHGRIYNNKTSIDELPTVQCLPMKLLLRELNIHHIDIWILDVEGAEESVLKGTDFTEVHFNTIAMECDDHDITKNERKTSILESNGFICQLVERNCMCRHRDFRPSSANYRTELKKWDGSKWSKSYSKKQQQS